jgi:hypothetical protein
MILLDHNIPEHQVALLRQARLQPQQIGRDVGRPEWQDFEEILRYLHHLKAATFISRDEDFFHRRLRHSNYCLVVVSGLVIDTARDIRRFLRHPFFRAKRQRMEKVVRLASTGIVWWELGRDALHRHAW